MELIYLFICLLIVLITLEYYIISGFHARTHRLLPLVLGLLALYDFYLIVEVLTGQHATFELLKQLLLVQLLDVILYYILDSTNVKISLFQNIILFSLLICMDIVIFVSGDDAEISSLHLMGFVVVSVVGLMVLLLKKAPRKEFISKQMRRNNQILITAVFIPAITLLLTIFNITSPLFLASSINITCIILFYLFVTDRLREVDVVLKEEQFQMLEIPAFIFDTDFFFLDASKKARECFPNQIKEIEASPNQYELQAQLREMEKANGPTYRTIDDVFYRCDLQEAEYNGKKKGYILTFTDITEQKKEAEFAKEVARQKSDFLASMSHDLRSPLHAIIGSSEIVLSRGEMSSRNATMVNHIHEAGNNLLDIVNSILDFSKLESGNFKLVPDKYNFKNLVEEQADLAFTNLKDKDVEFSVEVLDPFPEYLMGDEIRVRQIIQNLISNAVKFTDAGHIICKFSIRIEDEHTVHIIYSVKDSGCGMSKEQLETVFSDYVTYASETKKEGTGLGLSIVRKLAEMMGGSVRAESDGRTGSTITIEFNQQLIDDDIISMRKTGISLLEPFTISSANEVDATRIWKNEVEPNFVFPKAKVLIADDMAVNCEIFKELAAPWKFQIDVAVNGLEAAKLAKSNSYDLIFLDQMMPVMTGTEAADEMHRNNINVPMILLTANITESMKEQSREHGFKAFMQKPIDIVSLRENIEKYLPENLRELYDENQNMITEIGSSKEEWYEKALKIYVDEMSELYLVLPDYMKNDINLFRNKVHGIKGVSRQLGKQTLATLAEIMEMAAVSEHYDFIKENFNMFYCELEHVIQASRQELLNYKKPSADDVDGDADEIENDVKEVSTKEIFSLLEWLKVAFEDYEMSDIDEIFAKLDEYRLDDEIAEIINKAKEFYEDMEYEDALDVIAEFLEEWNY